MIGFAIAISLLVVLLLVILLLPVTYSIIGQKQDKTSFQGRIRWLFGNLEIALNYDSDSKMNYSIRFCGKYVNLKKQEHKKENSKGKTSFQGIRQILNRPFIKCIIQLFERFMGQLKPRKFIIDGKIGFADPYYTGLLSSIVYSITISGVTITPIFHEEVLEGNMIMEGRLILGLAAILFLQFLLKKPVRKVIKEMIRNKRGEKQNVNE